MKTFVRTMLFTAFAAACPMAQTWNTSLDVATINTFFPLMTADVNTVYAGNRKTVDAGGSWNAFTITTGRFLPTAGQFFDQSNGVVLGMAGLSGTPTLFRTVNGGMTWAYKTSTAFIGDPAAMHFFDMAEGYALTKAGNMMKTADSGSTWQTLGALGVSGYALFFTSPTNGYALGDANAVYKTTNGAVSWTAVPVTSTARLRSLHFPTATTGYAVGDSGAILKTVDGGSSWNLLSQGAYPNLRDVRFWNADFGYAVGAGGAILKTTNGGALWTVDASGTTRALHAVRFAEPGVAFAAADSGLILRAGAPSGTIFPPTGFNYPRASAATWIVGAPVADTPGIVATIPTFTVAPPLPPGISLDNSTGIISGTPSATATPGAASYVVTASNPAGSAKDTLTITIAFAPPAGLRYYYPHPRTWAVGVPILENTAIVTGFGLTFSSVPALPAGLVLNAATGSIKGVPAAASAQAAYTIIATNPGGSDSVALSYGVGLTSWDSLVTGAADQNLASLHFRDSLLGFVGGYGSILKTTNAGVSWQKVVAGEREVQAVEFSSATSGYAVSDAGRTLLRTGDGGVTWVPEEMAGSGAAMAAAAIHVAPGGSVYIGARSNIVKSANSGGSWTPYVLPSSPVGIRFASGSRGYALGRDGTAFRTTDAGTIWNASASTLSAQLTSAHFIDSSTWVAVGNGGTIARTADGGASWSLAAAIPAINLTSVAFAGPSRGWAVGDSGLIMTTADGGATWSRMITGRTIPLSAVAVAPGGHVYVAGMDGVLLKSDSAHTVGVRQARMPRENAFAASYRSGELVLSYTLAAPTPLDIRVLDLRGRVLQRLALARVEDGAKTLALPLDSPESGFRLVEITTNSSRHRLKLPQLAP